MAKKVAPKASAKSISKPVAKSTAKVGGRAASKPAAKGAAKPVAKAPAKPTKNVSKAPAKAVAKSSDKVASKANSKAALTAGAASGIKSSAKTPAPSPTKATTKVAEKVVSKGEMPSKSTKALEKAPILSAKPNLKLVRNEVADEDIDTPTEVPESSTSSKIRQETKAVTVKPAKKEKKLKLDKSGLNEEQAAWADYRERHHDEKPQNYTISGTFEAKKPLQHKLFGWGYILSNEYDRLEVLFEGGKRMLISNRKL